MNLIKSNIPAHVYVSHVEKHHELKPQILNSIKNFGEFSYRSPDNSISNTDWHLSPQMFRQYRDIINQPIAQHLEAVRIANNYTAYSIGSCWFQQYKMGDYHDWHTHGECMFANVYYVELPEGSPKTTFLHNGEEFSIDVQEGDILTFPSYLVHRSPPNQIDSLKTVISFNSNFRVGSY
jgi:hypothetical protein